jgi:hypothetical protein
MSKIVRKNGGMYFWKLGRFGGTFYITKKKTAVKPKADDHLAARIAAIRNRRIDIAAQKEADYFAACSTRRTRIDIDSYVAEVGDPGQD